ncbi:MAG: type II toxin-antitoxin system VapC family toxin [Nitrosomonadales bacterium]|nr:type II toxin-antitoxin system VapC family toxin [Nitrosomonadales bacterium]
MGSCQVNLVLLDTHVWVWLLNGDRKLNPKALKAIEQSLAEEAVLLSAISPWEVAMLVSKGRLTLDRDVGEWVSAAAGIPGIRIEAITPEIAVASTRLPGNIHPDPADRLIAATARHLGALLITEDQLLLNYAAAKHLKALKAGR